MNVKRFFTLIELLVVIAIIGILASMLLPALKNAKDSAIAIKCMGNLKQQGTVMNMYCDSFDGWFPKASTSYPSYLVWIKALNNADLVSFDNGDGSANISAEMFFCQKDELGWGYRKQTTQIYNLWVSYGINYRHLVRTHRKMNNITNPTKTLVLVEACSSSSSRGYGLALSWMVGGNPRACPRHGRKSNVLYVDGHVESAHTGNGGSSGLYVASELGTKYSDNNAWTADGKPASGE